MQARFWLIHDCMPMHAYWKYKPQPASIAQGDQNKRDLLAREVVGTLISSYGAHGRLEVPEIKWVWTNNYKFHTFRSVHFDSSLSPRPSFRFSEGLVPRLHVCVIQCYYDITGSLVRPPGWKVISVFHCPGSPTRVLRHKRRVFCDVITFLSSKHDVVFRVKPSHVAVLQRVYWTALQNYPDCWPTSGRVWLSRSLIVTIVMQACHSWCADPLFACA